MPEVNHLVERISNNEYESYYRAALIVSAIYNVNRDSKKTPKAYTPEDIIGKREQQERTPDEMETMAQVWTDLLGSGD